MDRRTRDLFQQLTTGTSLTPSQVTAARELFRQFNALEAALALERRAGYSQALDDLGMPAAGTLEERVALGRIDLRAGRA